MFLVQITNEIRGRATFVAITLAVAVALPVAAVGLSATETAAAETIRPQPEPAAMAPVTAAPRAGVAYVPAGGADLRSGPDGKVTMRISEGIALGFLHRSGDSLLVTTTCDTSAWVDAAEVEVTAQHQRATPGPGFDIGSSVVVLDPGHGDRDWGGVGPSGLSEKEVNLDIAIRVRTLMSAGHNVDWTSGAISPGSDVPAFGAVWLTRASEGPAGGDFEAGLGYRATLANGAGADAFVSIHNNTVPRVATMTPGTEVYYSVGAPGSDRLAGIIYEEMLRGFESFDAEWRGGEIRGPRARIAPETGDDYYGVLRRAEAAAIIVEGLYISEPDEEALLRSDEVRNAYAAAVYRGVVRYLTTTDEGARANPPELYPDDSGTVSGEGCVVPGQP